MLIQANASGNTLEGGMDYWLKSAFLGLDGNFRIKGLVFTNWPGGFG